MSLWNDKLIEYTEMEGLPQEREALLDTIANGEMYAEDAVEEAANCTIRAARKVDRPMDEKLLLVQGMGRMAEALGVKVSETAWEFRDGYPVMSSGVQDGPSIGGDAEDDSMGSVETRYCYDEPTGKAYVGSYVDWGHDVADLCSEFTTKENLGRELADQLSHGLDILSENAAMGGPPMSEEAYEEACQRIRNLMKEEV